MENNSDNGTDEGLKSVIRRIYEIAKEFYKSDIHTHIPSIYNRLTDHEQVVFLKGMIPFLFQAETPPRAIEIVGEENENDFDVNEYNQIELIKLKTWLIKCVIIMIAFFLATATIYIFANLLSPHASSEGMFEEFDKFLETFLEL